MEARKTEIAMCDCNTSDLQRVGEECRKLETTARERSKRKVRRRKKTMKKDFMVNSPLTTVMPRI